MPSFQHIPVLPQETLKFWHTKKGGLYLDATIGSGGHAKMLLEKDPEAVCLGFDQDPLILEFSEERLKQFNQRVRLFHSNYSKCLEILTRNNFSKVHGLLIDMGVSSYQLDDSARGFSFKKEGPLDMRMNPNLGETAEELIRRQSVKELAKIIRDFGEETFANQIAVNLKKLAMNPSPLTTTRCAQVVADSIPVRRRTVHIHPATKTFQALRIAVNRELENLEIFLNCVPEIMERGGHFVAISFHSLEDRIIKNKLRKWNSHCQCPSDFPICVCGKRKEFSILTPKALAPTQDEIKKNPRSRSAKLRAAEKC